MWKYPLVNCFSSSSLFQSTGLPSLPRTPFLYWAVVTKGKGGKRASLKFHFRPGEEKRRIPFFAISRFPTERRGKEGRAENNSFFFLLLQKITSSFLFPLEFRATGEIKRFFFVLSLPPSFAASRSIIYLGWILLPPNPRFPIQPPFLLR